MREKIFVGYLLVLLILISHCTAAQNILLRSTSNSPVGDYINEVLVDIYESERGKN